MNGADARAAVSTVDDWFASARSDPRRRRVGLAVAVVVGLGLAWLHWLGLVVAGALVGLTRTSLGRAVAAGVGFGGLVLVVFVLTTPVGGLTWMTALSPASYVTVAGGLGAPAWGALVRGVV
jgi:hypothetical protein